MLTWDADDDAVKASHKDKFASLGEVMVKLTRCRKAGADKTDHKTSFSSAAEKGIPEKALKGRAIGAHAKCVFCCVLRTLTGRRADDCTG